MLILLGWRVGPIDGGVGLVERGGDGLGIGLRVVSVGIVRHVGVGELALHRVVIRRPKRYGCVDFTVKPARVSGVA